MNILFPLALLPLLGGPPMVGAETFTLGFLPALSELTQNRYFLGAAECAIQDINRLRLGRRGHRDGDSGGPGDAKDQEGHKLELEVKDNKGDTRTSIEALTELYLYKKPVAFIGPEETCAVEARVADAWNLPMIAWVSP
jgi:hypothetical protein